ncbi:MAG: SpoIIE family protein phosphatase [Tepidisphaerales bacterium]
MDDTDSSTSAVPPASASLTSAEGSSPTTPSPAEPASPSADPATLHLTDFLDLATLQEIQDAFAALASVKARITDAQGNPLTQSAPNPDFLRRQRAIADAEAKLDGEETLASPAPLPASGPPTSVAAVTPGAAGDYAPARAGREYVAPIVVNHQKLGLLRMTPSPGVGLDESKLQQLAERFNLDVRTVRQLLQAASRARNDRPAAIQFLFILANAIARLCYQEYQLRQRVAELSALYNVSTILADARDLQSVLERAARVVCEVMGAKAASIRLIDFEKDELVIKAVHNLSPTYQKKGPVRLSTSGIDHVALSEKGYEYVRDMKRDPRVRYPQESEREGIVSMLSVGMKYKGKPIGVMRVYTEKEQTFSPLRIELLKAVAAQAAAAIENARLLEETLEAQRLEKQVEMAADVQKRMIPSTPPPFPAADVSAVYVPCYELGGDFYDFIPLGEESLGMAVADVSGKGVAASLIMAAVRSALRAQTDNVYYLHEVVRRINAMLCRDTLPTEFVTLFYGVLHAPTRRFTYCNAGHVPALILRQGEIIELGSDDMVLGVDPDQEYRQHIVDLLPDDLLLIYTDGLPDAMNFDRETFGRQRLMEAFRQGGATAEQVAQNILWSVRRFVGMAKRNDDITMIVARIR